MDLGYSAGKTNSSEKLVLGLLPEGDCDCAYIFQESVPDTKFNRLIDWIDRRKSVRLVSGLADFLRDTYLLGEDVNWKEYFPWHKERSY
jgi:hypothetical protein